MRNIRNRRGAALPLVLLITSLLTLAIVASWTLNGAEARINDDHREQLEAFSLAESGREQFVVSRAALGFTSMPPAASESAHIELPNGYADVVMRRIRAGNSTEPALYLLESRGVRERVSYGGAIPAQRTVAQYLYWRTGDMSPLAGWTSLSGLHKNGNSGSLSGVDECVPAKPSVAGVAVPTSPGYTGHTGPTAGSPAVRTLGTAAQAAAAVNIDWAGITNGTALTPNVTIPGGTWPSFNNASYWPIIKVNGDYTLPSSGRGVLIVTGTLTISGALTWDGVLLVGNNITSNGNNAVHGATITGLNVKLGMTVPKADVGNGTKTYRYNSCNIERAMANMSVLVPYTNGWMDNWASY
jgi:hypothetical protein